MTNDVASPGGWLNLLNTRVGRWLVVGALAVSGGGGGAVSIYGYFQGGKAAQVVEARLVSSTKDTVTYSVLNPLPNDESGAIMPTYTNGIWINENTAPATRLNICTAASASTVCASTSTLANVASGVVLGGAKRFIPLSTTGAVAIATSHGVAPIILAPRNDTSGKRYLNFTFTRGSGATASGGAAAVVHIEITPCNVLGAGC
jgi:hypothetical protein